MRFNPLNLRPLRTGLLVVAALAATGWALDPLEQPAWAAVRAREPALKLGTLQAALGQGVTVGLLGGFRALAADFLWVKGEVLWEDHDAPATQSCLKLVTTIDPRPLYFWINSSKMVAYDMPDWRIRAEGGYEVVPKRRQQAIVLEQATVGLEILQEALTYHPNSWFLYETMANIHWQQTKDFAAAAVLYKLAAEQPGEGGWAGRQHARMLQNIGRYQEAYDWLLQRYAKLPKPPGTPGSKEPATNQPLTVQQTTDAGEATEMLEWIRKLEHTLNLPAERAYQP